MPHGDSPRAWNYDVFLSYDTRDERVVEEFVQRLRAEGLNLFLDKWPAGDSWASEIEEALRQSRTFAILLGPSGLLPFQREEMEAALARTDRDRSYRVIPVLLPGASPSELPVDLQGLPWVDFRGGLADPVAFRRLIAAIEGPALWEEKEPIPFPLGGRPDRSPRFTFRPRLKDVWLSTAAPPQVARNSKFVARFSAYTEEYRSQVTKAVIAEAPEAKLHLDLHTCQWEPGTKVTVTLSAEPLHVEEPSQPFVWNGKWEILKFDVSAPDSITEGRFILRFDVFVEGLKIAKLRPELKIVHSQTAEKEERELEIVTAPDKAFASYASPDRREVLGRIRSLQIFTRIDVFLDCLSIHPGEPWKDRIKDEIADRDIFWLFWSRNALQSEWVDWEWRTALAGRTLDYIQPHPLEGPDVAPPPTELAALQFGSLYESFLSQMKRSWWECRVIQYRRVIRRVFASEWLPVLLAAILFVAVVVGFKYL